jgi:glycosyltransferase involved in cell wall biosynthesis
LLLATVGNQPSFNGIKTLITDYQSASPLFLAGYGTDVFSESCSSNVSVLGEVSDEKLFELMASVKALIINQPQTTGFLTKIIESNLAGLPVIVVSKYVQAEKLEEYGIFIGNIDTLDTWECVDPVFGFKKFSMPYDSLFRELR